MLLLLTIRNAHGGSLPEEAAGSLPNCHGIEHQEEEGERWQCDGLAVPFDRHLGGCGPLGMLLVSLLVPLLPF